MRMKILKQGRVSHFVPGEGIEDPDEYKKKLMERAINERDIFNMFKDINTLIEAKINYLFVLIFVE